METSNLHLVDTEMNMKGANTNNFPQYNHQNKSKNQALSDLSKKQYNRTVAVEFSVHLVNKSISRTIIKTVKVTSTVVGESTWTYKEVEIIPGSEEYIGESCYYPKYTATQHTEYKYEITVARYKNYVSVIFEQNYIP